MEEQDLAVQQNTRSLRDRLRRLLQLVLPQMASNAGQGNALLPAARPAFSCFSQKRRGAIISIIAVVAIVVVQRTGLQEFGCAQECFNQEQEIKVAVLTHGSRLLPANQTHGQVQKFADRRSFWQPLLTPLGVG